MKSPMCHLWWPDLWVAWLENMDVSSPMSWLLVVTRCRDVVMTWTMILDVALPMTTMVAQAFSWPSGDWT